jgi:hypothetical protein
MRSGIDPRPTLRAPDRMLGEVMDRPDRVRGAG